MSKRVTSGVVAAIAALAMSVPTVGFANKGGTPHKTPTGCHHHKHTGKHKGAGKGHKKGSGKGNKCGSA